MIAKWETISNILLIFERFSERAVWTVKRVTDSRKSEVKIRLTSSSTISLEFTTKSRGWTHPKHTVLTPLEYCLEETCDWKGISTLLLTSLFYQENPLENETVQTDFMRKAISRSWIHLQAKKAYFLVSHLQSAKFTPGDEKSLTNSEIWTQKVLLINLHQKTYTFWRSERDQRVLQSPDITEKIWKRI